LGDSTVALGGGAGRGVNLCTKVLSAEDQDHGDHRGGIQRDADTEQEAIDQRSVYHRRTARWLLAPQVASMTARIIASGARWRRAWSISLEDVCFPIAHTWERGRVRGQGIAVEPGCRYAWTVNPTLHPYNQLYPSFVEASIGGGNASRWVNARFEELMAQAAAYTEEDELVTIMKEAQNILTEQDPPAIYYGQQLWYTVLRKDIEGFGWNPLYLSSYHPLRSLTRAAA
jgi:ABC-type transport system substrate-binding protein